MYLEKVEVAEAEGGSYEGGLWGFMGGLEGDIVVLRMDHEFED